MAESNIAIQAAATDIFVLRSTFDMPSFFLKYVTFNMEIHVQVVLCVERLHQRLQTALVLLLKLKQWEKPLEFYGVSESTPSKATVESIVGQMYNDAFKQMLFESWDLFADIADVPSLADVRSFLQEQADYLQKRWNSFPTLCDEAKERKHFLQTVRDRLLQDLSSVQTQCLPSPVQQF